MSFWGGFPEGLRGEGGAGVEAGGVFELLLGEVAGIAEDELLGGVGLGVDGQADEECAEAQFADHGAEGISVWRGVPCRFGGPEDMLRPGRKGDDGDVMEGGDPPGSGLAGEHEL